MKEAELRLRNECLAEGGYPEQLYQGQGYTEPPNESVFRDVPLQPRTEEDARERGFGQPLPAEPGSLIWDDPAYQAKLQECEEAAAEKLPALDNTHSEYTDLRRTVRTEVGTQAQPVLEEYSAALSKCLAKQGYKREDGEDINWQQGFDQFGVVDRGSHVEVDASPPTELPGGGTWHPGTPEREYVTTAEESKFAVAWVKCGVESELFAAIDEQWEDALAKAIEQHEDAFAELVPKIQDLVTTAAEATGQ